MTMRRWAMACAAVAFFASPFAAHAGSARLTWREVAERQRAENATLLAARYRVAQAEADVLAAGVWTNPNVSVNTLSLTHGAITGGTLEVATSLEQTVPLAGQVGLRQRAFESELSAEKQAFRAEAWHLLNDARAAFVGLVFAQRKIVVLQRGLQDLDRVLGIVTERSLRGASSAYDKLRVGVERSKLLARLADSRAGLVDAKTELASKVGRSLEPESLEVEEEDVSTGALATDSLRELVARGVRQRPELFSLQYRAAAAEGRASLGRRSLIPTPTLSLGYARYMGVADANNLSGGAMLAGISLPLPLFDRGQGRIDRHVAEAAEARALRAAAQLAVEREVERAFSGLSIRLAALTRFREDTAPDLPKLRASAELSYREGRASVVELLDAYSSYLDAQERQLELELRVAVARTELERAVGPRL